MGVAFLIDFARPIVDNAIDRVSASERFTRPWNGDRLLISLTANSADPRRRGALTLGSRKVLNTLRSRLLITFLGLFAAPGFAQNTPDLQTDEFAPYTLDSGKLGTTERDASVVFEETITVRDAVRMRLYFSEVELRPGSSVRMTSMLDGGTQELDGDGLTMWNYTSAYFNGGSVHLELIAAPKSVDNRIAFDRVAVKIVQAGRGEPCNETDCGICGGVDDRVPSFELWAGRLMPTGCTASIYNTASSAVTAGHCSACDLDQILQFNVPLSDPGSCSMNAPGPEHQFPITGHLCRWSRVEPLTDWSVMTVGTNHLGETPYERYGVYRPIASVPAGQGDPVEVFGYGMDNDDRDRSQTQQHSTGHLFHLDIHDYYCWVDIMNGNSGSALLHDGEIIGVVSVCSNAKECWNRFSRIDAPEFAAARASMNFSHFAGCMSGPGQPLAPACEPADIDADNDVDMADFAAVQSISGCESCPPG